MGIAEDKLKRYNDIDGELRRGDRISISGGEDLRQEIMEEAHYRPYAMHPGSTKIYHDLKSCYTWNGMKRVRVCIPVFNLPADQNRTSKAGRDTSISTRTGLEVGLYITMDFLTGLPRSHKGNDAIWVIVDRLIKVAHFLPLKMTFPLDQLAKIYVEEIVRLHGIPETIISDRNARFTSRFWAVFQKALGTKLKFSTAYHPQTDGQSKRTIQTPKDMLRACVMDFQGGRNDWKSYLPLIKFAYNNSVHSSLEMLPYEDLYGRKCRTPICWYEIGE